MRSLLSIALLTVLAVACGAPDSSAAPDAPAERVEMPETVASEAPPEAESEPEWGQLTDAEWRERLTDEEYRILREKGTERAYTGAYHATKTKGTYECAGCGEVLFVSDTKYDSGCGWPSFYEPLNGEVIAEHDDTSHGMVRTEVTCKKCGGHLGHVFTDGPQPTGLRYCINSVSIKLRPEDDAKPPAEK
jgi:peptide-methionine (R)-S-oxide reductase